MADFGLYSALRGTDDFQTKRADAAMAMQIASIRQQTAQQNLQKQMQMEEGMQSAFDAMANLDVLTEDGDRIKALERESRKKIVQGVAKYGGDLAKYMASGGVSDLHQYKNSIMQSEEYKNAVANKINLKAYMDDRSKDLFEKQTTVDAPVIDPKTGQTIMVPTKMNMAQQLSLFQQGKINRLNYAGAEKKIDLGIEDFNKMIKDPSKPYSKDNIVTMSEVYEKALSKGASEEQASYQAKKYAAMIQQGGQPWNWNVKDDSELKLGWANLAERKRQFNTTRADKMNGEAGGPNEIKNTFGNRQELMGPGQIAPIGKKEYEYIINSPTGFQQNKDGTLKFMGDAIIGNSGKTANLSTSNLIPDPLTGRTLSIYKGDDGKMYWKGRASLGADLSAQDFGETVKINAGDGLFGLGATTDVLIPADSYYNNPTWSEQGNEFVKTGTHQTRDYADFTNTAAQGKAAMMQNEINAAMMQAAMMQNEINANK